VQSQSRADLGLRGEAEAVVYYRRLGFRVIATNWRCRLGEIDLVLSKGSMVVFCEVKTRRGSALGGPHESVTWKKQRKLRQLGEAFLSSLSLEPSAVRFDVASVIVGPGSGTSIHLFEGAF
jgi:putative endonuclease